MNRVAIARIVFLLCLVLLCGRLYYIQVTCQEELSLGAEQQQLVPVLQDYSRGTIYDRNMEKLTETSWNYYYLIPRKYHTEKCKLLLSLIGGQIQGKKGDDYIVYGVESYQYSVNLYLQQQYHAYGFSLISRYDDNQVAAHIIGYVNEADGIGASGLEKVYNQQLRSEAPMSFLLGSGTGSLFGGAGITKGQWASQSLTASLVTTIDKGLQTYIEGLLQEEQLTGAVAVMDVETSQILTMASSPTFNPNQLENYLDSSGEELVNHAVQGEYPPGSVFKIVVAAAALENGIDGEREFYTCEGSTEVNGVKMVCSGHEDGHGRLNLYQAFAQSCNCYFAHLAKSMGDDGSEKILAMAEQMGFGQQVFSNLSEEAKGNLPPLEERSYSGLANFAIGQGSLLVTPLQVCQMTNIVASQGIKREASLLLQKETETVREKEPLVLDEEAAEKLAEMMSLVMEEGTGSSFDFPVTVAGKTGSAEASDGHGPVVHGWFTGFFPTEEPKYTVTVFIENGKTGSGSALPVFQQIVNYLY